MKRVPLPELEDYPWFPAPLRDTLTGFLRTASDVLGVSQVAAPLVLEALDASDADTIVDLCSGGGGPVVGLARELSRRGRAPQVVLTDKFPNRAAFERVERELGARARGVVESVDATALPPALRGVRTMFNALHHLPPAVARAVFADAAAQGQPIVTFEFVERSAQGGAILASLPLAVYGLMPFVKPRKLLGLALTYGTPLIPALVWWDGFASCMRAYDLRELAELIAGLDRTDYHFRIERRRVPGRPLYVTSVVGLPRR